MQRLMSVVITLLLLSASSLSADETPKTARFRATVCGFQCIKQSVDHCFKVDGSGDEVWVAATVKEYERPSLTLRTPTMGDVGGSGVDKPGRIQAGTDQVHPNGKGGGLKDTDSFPDKPFENPQAIPDEGGWKKDSRPTLPFVLWEGKLTSGQSGVDLALSIWEDDEGRPETWLGFLGALNDPVVSQGIDAGLNDALKSGDVTIQVSGVGPLLADVLKTVFGVAGDRTIGKMAHAAFTFEKMQNAAKTQSGDLPVGVLAYEFKDTDVPAYTNHGHYVVWLKIEEIK
jgi:hypothetical protein